MFRLPDNQLTSLSLQSLPRSGSGPHLKDAAEDITKATEYVSPKEERGKGNAKDADIGSTSCAPRSASTKFGPVSRIDSPE